MFLSYIVRAFTVVFGVTAPPPESERRYGWVILISLVAIAAGCVTLLLTLAGLIMR
jgi:hypothetical protein